MSRYDILKGKSRVSEKKTKEKLEKRSRTFVPSVSDLASSVRVVPPQLNDFMQGAGWEALLRSVSLTAINMPPGVPDIQHGLDVGFVSEAFSLVEREGLTVNLIFTNVVTYSNYLRGLSRDGPTPILAIETNLENLRRGLVARIWSADVYLNMFVPDNTILFLCTDAMRGCLVTPAPAVYRDIGADSTTVLRDRRNRPARDGFDGFIDDMLIAQRDRIRETTVELRRVLDSATELLNEYRNSVENGLGGQLPAENPRPTAPDDSQAMRTQGPLNQVTRTHGPLRIPIPPAAGASEEADQPNRESDFDDYPWTI